MWRCERLSGFQNQLHFCQDTDEDVIVRKLARNRHVQRRRTVSVSWRPRRRTLQARRERGFEKKVLPACRRLLSLRSDESMMTTTCAIRYAIFQINFVLDFNLLVFTVLSVSPAHQWQCVTQNNTARTVSGLCSRRQTHMVRRHEWTVGQLHTSSTSHGSLHSHKCTHTSA